MYYTIIQKDNVILVLTTHHLTPETIVTLLTLGYTIYQSALKADESGYIFHKEMQMHCRIFVDLMASDPHSIHSTFQSHVQEEVHSGVLA